MKKTLYLVGGLLVLFGLVRPVLAMEKKVEILEMMGITEEAPQLDSGQATESAEATSAGTIKLEQATQQDITQRESPIKGKLEGYLLEKDPGPLSYRNFIQYGIRQAVAKGVSPNTIVLILLFPLVASMIAASRHLLGLTGFGIFVPANPTASTRNPELTGMSRLIVKNTPDDSSFGIFGSTTSEPKCVLYDQNSGTHLQDGRPIQLLLNFVKLNEMFKISSVGILKGEIEGFEWDAKEDD